MFDRTRLGLFLITVFAAACSQSDPSSFESALGSPGLVISQVYGGGGNGGSNIDYDYIELFNRGASDVNVNGMSVQYASNTGTTWKVQALSSSNPVVMPGHYFLVRLASNVMTPLTPMDLPVMADVRGPASGTGSIDMSGTNGKVALVSNAIALSGCGTAAMRCVGLPNVVDFLGYGTAADFEGIAAAPALATNKASLRGGSGCIDTDENKNDFANGTWIAGPAGVTLHNSGSTANPCAPIDDDGGTIGDDGGPLVISEDGGEVDLSTPPDLSVPDLSTPDLSLPDLSMPDLSMPDLTASVDLTQPDLMPPSDDAGPSVGAGLIVLSQVYGAGGNSGAAYTNDFIELFNRSTTVTVPLDGWSVQYGSAANNFSQKANLPAGASIAPGHYFLVQLASGANGATPPAADFAAAGTEAFNLSATSGKVAVTANTTLLACGGTGARCTSTAIIDLIGYGSAADFEGTVTPAPTAAKSLFRKLGGCLDTNDNANDIQTDAVAPRNSASTANDCSNIVVMDLGVPHDLAVRDLSMRDLSATDGPARDLSAPIPPADLSAPADAQVAVDLSHATPRNDDSGCSCELGGSRRPATGATGPLLLLLAALAFVLRRRALR